MEKICICCKKSQPTDNFYKHSGMSDGRLNKCKDCCKSQSNERYKKLIENVDFLQAERKRGRQKYRKYLYKQSPAARKKGTKNYRHKYPEKMASKNALTHRKIRAEKGFHFHHWSYNKEHFFDIFQLTPKRHVEIHQGLKYEPTQKMYIDLMTGVLLDSREKMGEFIQNYVYEHN